MQDLSIIKVATTVSRIVFRYTSRRLPIETHCIPQYPINKERSHILKVPGFYLLTYLICSRQTYQHKDVHTSRLHRKVPYMECEVDQRGILSHFHLHMARFSHRVFGIL